MFADAVQPSTVTANAPPIQCLLTPQGPAYEKPAIALSYPSTSLLFGDEREKVNDKPISEQLTVRFPPEQFGRDYDYTITLVQPEEGPQLPRTTHTRCASQPARGTGAMSSAARRADVAEAVRSLRDKRFSTYHSTAGRPPPCPEASGTGAAHRGGFRTLSNLRRPWPGGPRRRSPVTDAVSDAATMVCVRQTTPAFAE